MCTSTTPPFQRMRQREQANEASLLRNPNQSFLSNVNASSGGSDASGRSLSPSIGAESTAGGAAFPLSESVFARSNINGKKALGSPEGAALSNTFARQMVPVFESVRPAGGEEVPLFRGGGQDRRKGRLVHGAGKAIPGTPRLTNKHGTAPAKNVEQPGAGGGRKGDLRKSDRTGLGPDNLPKPLKVRPLTAGKSGKMFADADLGNIGLRDDSETADTGKPPILVADTNPETVFRALANQSEKTAAAGDNPPSSANVAEDIPDVNQDRLFQDVAAQRAFSHQRLTGFNKEVIQALVELSPGEYLSEATRNKLLEQLDAIHLRVRNHKDTPKHAQIFIDNDVEQIRQGIRAAFGAPEGASPITVYAHRIDSSGAIQTDRKKLTGGARDQSHKPDLPSFDEKNVNGRDKDNGRNEIAKIQSFEDLVGAIRRDLIELEHEPLSQQQVSNRIQTIIDAVERGQGETIGISKNEFSSLKLSAANATSPNGFKTEGASEKFEKSLPASLRKRIASHDVRQLLSRGDEKDNQELSRAEVNKVTKLLEALEAGPMSTARQSVGRSTLDDIKEGFAALSDGGRRFLFRKLISKDTPSQNTDTGRQRGGSLRNVPESRKFVEDNLIGRPVKDVGDSIAAIRSLFGGHPINPFSGRLLTPREVLDVQIGLIFVGADMKDMLGSIIKRLN